MNKYKPIIQDGLILIVVATVFVTICNEGFKTLKKGGSSDPLVTAVNQGKLATVQDLLGEKGFEKTKAEFTSLGDFQKARANRQDDFGRTPLMWAAYSNFADAKETAETDKKRLALVEYLTSNGADVNATDKDGWTALSWAAWSGMPEVAAKLLEKGANTAVADRQGNTPLIIAAQRGNTAIVKLLLEKGADKAAQAREGKKALDFAQEGMKQYRSKASAYQEILGLLAG